ncbi:MAG: septal ring lytic transglycosylase RlpA family protein [Pseudolabrys sp.]
MPATDLRPLMLAGILVAALDPALAQTTTTFSGKAAYYDPNYKGRTASGEPYDATKFTAAHKTLPFGTQVRVTDTKTGRDTIVTINDRGPFNKGRVIDLSLAAAEQIGMIKRGIITIRAVVIAPLKPSAGQKPN